jgi:hypothetical protein
MTNFTLLQPFDIMKTVEEKQREARYPDMPLAKDDITPEVKTFGLLFSLTTLTPFSVWCQAMYALIAKGNALIVVDELGKLLGTGQRVSGG